MAQRNLSLRRAYAEHRMGVAIERILVARTERERTKASKWAYAWRDFNQGSTHDVRQRSHQVTR